ncbi:hypothetical protein [Kineosporia babensis]
MADPDQRYFFVSQNAAGWAGALREAKASLGDGGGFLTCEGSFTQYAVGEYFQDVEGRFPIQELVECLEDRETPGPVWFADLTPQQRPHPHAQLALAYPAATELGYALTFVLVTTSLRYIATLVPTE